MVGWLLLGLTVELNDVGVERDVYQMTWYWWSRLPASHLPSTATSHFPSHLEQLSDGLSRLWAWGRDHTNCSRSKRR